MGAAWLQITRYVYFRRHPRSTYGCSASSPTRHSLLPLTSPSQPGFTIACARGPHQKEHSASQNDRPLFKRCSFRRPTELMAATDGRFDKPSRCFAFPPHAQSHGITTCTSGSNSGGLGRVRGSYDPHRSTAHSLYISQFKKRYPIFLKSSLSFCNALYSSRKKGYGNLDLCILCLDQISHLFRHSQGRSCRMSSGNPAQSNPRDQRRLPCEKKPFLRWEYTGINNSQSPDAVNLQLFIHNTPIFSSRHPCGAGRMV